MLTRLIYASEATDPLSPGLVDEILATARAQNRLHDITGMLMFDHRCFLQVLEGDRQRLSDLYGNLVRDRRHTRLLILQCGPVDERLFVDWSMGFAAADASLKRRLLRHTASSQFDPHRLGAASALALLAAMADAAPPANDSPPPT